MRILMVCAEFAPWAKTGGLADAVTGLSDALAASGHDVRVLMPKYSHLDAARNTGSVAGRGAAYRFAELEPGAGTEHQGRRDAKPRVLLLDLGELEADRIYTGDSRDAGRFLRLSAAAAAVAATDAWRPNVVHCHDWHAALTPVFQRLDRRDAPPSVLTLHNVGYQGVFAAAALRDYGFESLEGALPPDARAGGVVNFLRAGVRAADRVTTVSPTYAAEIRRPEFGMGLEDALAARGADLVGILNGVDYGVWSPEGDPFLPDHYGSGDPRPKRRIKNRLTARLGIAGDGTAPLIGVVSRLAHQKGIDLVAAAIPALLADTRASFALLGSGDAGVTAELRRLTSIHRDRVSFTDDYNEQLAHEILAGSDLMLVPSRYEPCGLTQLYALRYGTIPVVRATGGLADTVQHYDPATGRGTGSVFRDADPQGLLWGVRTALGWLADGPAWARLMTNAMNADFSWRNQVPQYEAVYRSLL